MFSNNKKVLYYHDDIIGTYQYASGHPMKPFRVAMTNELVQEYGLYKKLDIYVIFSIRITIFVNNIYKIKSTNTWQNSTAMIILI